MTKTEIVSFVKRVRVEHDKKIAEKYVAKEDGKDLMLNTDKTKLDGIAAGAQVNVIEGVSIKGGAAGTIDSGTKTLTLDLDNYAKKEDVAAAFNPKGSKDTFAELPTTGNKGGDIWNIKIAGGTDKNGTPIKAGDNVVYVEDKENPENSGWDNYSGAVDLSGYVEKDGDKVLSTNDFTTEYKNKLDSLVSGSAETFSDDDITDIFSDDED